MNTKLSYYIALIFSVPIFWSCQPTPTENSSINQEIELNEELNPAAKGFNLEASDQKAIDIANEVMEAMGGRKSWDQTRFIAWNFFGRRTLVWDKLQQRARIEIPADSMVILVNTETKEGQVSVAGEALTNTDSLNKYLERGRNIWINDSYWLVMPFKLKDSGVTLNYVSEDTTAKGNMADVLSLTFENVGVTPQNKYLVYVDKESQLVSQWDFFQDQSKAEPRFSTPWEDYNAHGNILLSGNRGQYQLSDIQVFNNLPDEVFESLLSIDLSKY